MLDGLRVELSELKLLIVDRYTGAEIVERLELSAEDILDNFPEEVYNNLDRFDEVLHDLGVDLEDFPNDPEKEEKHTQWSGS